MVTLDPFAIMLTGGHPNSLGRTIEVVEAVLADQSRLAELYLCYDEPDETIRLRTSNALKRVCRARPEWLTPYIDRFLTEVAGIDQASAQWSLAQLCRVLAGHMTADQLKRAKKVLRRNLTQSQDWIVLNMTMQTLGDSAKNDPELGAWLRPRLRDLRADKRKSVAKWADKLARALYGESTH